MVGGYGWQLSGSPHTKRIGHRGGGGGGGCSLKTKKTKMLTTKKRGKNKNPPQPQSGDRPQVVIPVPPGHLVPTQNPSVTS